MSRSDLSYSQHDISAKFGKRSRLWFSRHKGDLINKRGFPPPLDAPGQKLWSKAQVDRWFETGGRTFIPDDAAEVRGHWDGVVAGNLASLSAAGSQLRAEAGELRRLADDTREDVARITQLGEKRA